jgi:amino-acid N-acetyltransferase
VHLVWAVNELEAETSLFGVISMERYGECAQLRSLAVEQGRGFGHQLVAWLEREARAAGVEQLALLTETAQEFFGAIIATTSVGYKHFGS